MNTTDTTDTIPDDAAPEAPETTEADDGKAGKEAARYRRQLREVEAARDQLAQRLEVLQRAEVERLAAYLAQPAAIWAAGVNLADVLDGDGNVDPEKAAPAITAAADRLGLAQIPGTPVPDPSQGSTGEAPASNEWTAAMRV